MEDQHAAARRVKGELHGGKPGHQNAAHNGRGRSIVCFILVPARRKVGIRAARADGVQVQGQLDARAGDGDGLGELRAARLREQTTREDSSACVLAVTTLTRRGTRCRMPSYSASGSPSVHLAALAMASSLRSLGTCCARCFLRSARQRSTDSSVARLSALRMAAALLGLATALASPMARFMRVHSESRDGWCASASISKHAHHTTTTLPVAVSLFSAPSRWMRSPRRALLSADGGRSSARGCRRPAPSPTTAWAS